MKTIKTVAVCRAYVHIYSLWWRIDDVAVAYHVMTAMSGGRIIFSDLNAFRFGEMNTYLCGANKFVVLSNLFSLIPSSACLYNKLKQ